MSAAALLRRITDAAAKYHGPGPGRHRAPRPALARIAVPLAGFGVDLPPCYRDEAAEYAEVRHHMWGHCPKCKTDSPGLVLEDSSFLCTSCDTTTKGDPR